MSAIRRCPDHGVFDAGATKNTENTENRGNTGDAGDAGHCPVCGTEGELVLDGERRRRLSTFLSGVLRHFPEDVDVALDDRGWADYDRVVEAASGRYPWADREAVSAVVATDPKGRFEREGMGGRGNREGKEQIRAAYGHSVDVSLEAGEDSVPDQLYHGTAPRNRASISEEGLRPMDRHEVHLSGTPADARAVGARHTPEPIVFAVDACGLIENGHQVTKRGNGVYTTDRVPPRYLSEYDRPDRAGATNP